MSAYITKKMREEILAKEKLKLNKIEEGRKLKNNISTENNVAWNMQFSRSPPCWSIEDFLNNHV